MVKNIHIIIILHGHMATLNTEEEVKGLATLMTGAKRLSLDRATPVVTQTVRSGTSMFVAASHSTGWCATQVANVVLCHRHSALYTERPEILLTMGPGVL